MSTPRAVWSHDRDTTLVTTLRQEQIQGRQAESGWKQQSYQAVVDALAADDVRVTVGQVTDRWAKVRTFATLCD
jgi:hypothetical protein